MNYFRLNQRRGNYNPYRQGVLIANFVEEIYGQDLKTKYRNEGEETKLPPISEFTDKYTRPELSRRDIKVPGNELTMTCNSNFDLNIDFNKKNCEDFLKLAKDNEFVLDNKNAFLPNEIKSEFQMKTFNETMSGKANPQDICNETQKRLKGFHINDTTGVLYTRKMGLDNKLLFGHGLNQRNFDKNEFSSTYKYDILFNMFSLTLNQKIPTSTFYNPKFKITEHFMHQPKTIYNTGDWPYRKFKTYEEFTKRIDHATIMEKK